MYAMVGMSLIPIGTDVSLSPYVAECQRILEEAGLEPELHANGTNIEGEWHTVMEAVRRCHEVLHDRGVVRINTNLKIGTRTDRPQGGADTVARVHQQRTGA